MIEFLYAFLDIALFIFLNVAVLVCLIRQQVMEKQLNDMQNTINELSQRWEK